jgi:hypothetical protein
LLGGKEYSAVTFDLQPADIFPCLLLYFREKQNLLYLLGNLVKRVVTILRYQLKIAQISTADFLLCVD